MLSVTFPSKVDEKILPALIELTRRSIDGTVKPLFVDYTNLRVGIGMTTGLNNSLNVSSTADFYGPINVTGDSVWGGVLNLNSNSGINSSGSVNLFASLSVTGNVNVTGGSTVTTGFFSQGISVTGATKFVATGTAASTFWRINDSTNADAIIRVREDYVVGLGQCQNVLSQTYLCLSSYEGEDSQLEFQADGGDDAGDIATIRKTPSGAWLFTNSNSQTDSAAHFRLSSGTVTVDTLTTGNFFSAINVTGGGKYISSITASAFYGDGGGLTNIPGSSTRTRQVLTAGSGATYTTPANCKYLWVRMVGGGGAGGGSIAGFASQGNSGGSTIFNNVTAGGGDGASTSASFIAGAAGSAVGGGTASIRRKGGAGGNAHGNSPSGKGGDSMLGPGAVSQVPDNNNGVNAGANTGGGGSGAGDDTGSGGGGGGGEYVELLITSPAATYTYTVGAGGTAGTSTYTGGVGGSGVIIVDEYY